MSLSQVVPADTYICTKLIDACIASDVECKGMQEEVNQIYFQFRSYDTFSVGSQLFSDSRSRIVLSVFCLLVFLTFLLLIGRNLRAIVTNWPHWPLWTKDKCYQKWIASYHFYAHFLHVKNVVMRKKFSIFKTFRKLMKKCGSDSPILGQRLGVWILTKST